MKHMRILLILLLALCLMPVAAAAEGEAAPVNILLNGEPMTLPGDVQPWFDPDSGCAYVPFRDVLEAMGATVDYDADTREVSARRGDIAVQFSQDGGMAAVLVDGEVVSMGMEAPPITREGRILVPIRFAGQALGAKVGWDSETRTVLIADIPALIEQRLGSYEILSGLDGLVTIDPALTYEADMHMTLLADIGQLLGYGTEVQLPVEGRLNALVGPDGFDATGSIRADVSAMLATIPGLSGNVQAEYGAEIIWNSETGMLYLQSPALAENMGLGYYGLEDLSAWLSYDGAELAVGLSDALGLNGRLPGEGGWAGVAAALMELAANDYYYLYSYESYENLLASMDIVNSFLEDSSFVRQDEGWVNGFALQDNGLTIEVHTVVEAELDGTVTGLTVRFELYDDTNRLTAELHLGAGTMELTAAMTGGAQLSLTLEATWAPTSARPRTEPPKGAEIVDPEALREQYYRDLMERYYPGEPEPEPKAV